MNTFSKISFLFLAICIVAHGTDVNAKTETKYWSTIKKLMVEMDKTKGREAKEAAATKYKEYIGSLSTEQLIITGREASQEADTICPETIFCERNVGSLMFVLYEYFQKDGLENIESLFNEIEDKNQTNFWRATLIEFLREDDWSDLLKSEQLYSIIDKIAMVISDKNEHPRLRYEASNTTRYIHWST